MPENSEDITTTRARLVAHGQVTAYQELCKSYHAIDSFRATLLGLLPLASGAGVFLLLNGPFTAEAKDDVAPALVGAIGIFGAVVTLALYFYELHGIRKCDHLINVGEAIEHDLGIRGQFACRPRQVDLFTARIGMNEPLAARVIYPAALAAWAFLPLYIVVPGVAPLVAMLAFVVGFYVPSQLNLGEPSPGRQARATPPVEPGHGS